MTLAVVVNQPFPLRALIASCRPQPVNQTQRIIQQRLPRKACRRTVERLPREHAYAADICTESNVELVREVGRIGMANNDHSTIILKVETPRNAQDFFLAATEELKQSRGTNDQKNNNCEHRSACGSPELPVDTTQDIGAGLGEAGGAWGTALAISTPPPPTHLQPRGCVADEVLTNGRRKAASWPREVGRSIGPSEPAGQPAGL
eukprot:CAMPEP_0114523100 /NCGR_PEP_ID=MMETSP0109-20121206/21107_1 /TAXON_ID=29199 /ORGANISM="Chlorarachnion reptans, Strain CCCM449" /LENGTH=204 /DNA_ID=CAMNT_0001704385 /DNA_START=820 /DNA_END=1435 /DNA_ORIENTATION=-